MSGASTKFQGSTRKPQARWVDIQKAEGVLTNFPNERVSGDFDRPIVDQRLRLDLSASARRRMDER
jgi:hypothetical protein